MPPKLDDNESNPTLLWAEIWRLRAAVQGPSGFETWQHAAVDERLKRVESEGALRTLRALLKHQVYRAGPNTVESAISGATAKFSAILTTNIQACLDNPDTQPQSIKLKAENQVTGVPDFSSWQATEARIKQLMEDVGLPNSQSLAQAFKQLKMEVTLYHCGSPWEQSDSDDLGIPPGATLPEFNETWLHEKSGAYYKVLGITSKPDPEKATKHPQSVYYEGPDGRRWVRTLPSWFQSFTPFAPALHIAGVLKKDDMRVIDGAIWYCTDPEIDRWVSQGELPNFTAPVTVSDAVALSDTMKEFIDTRKNFFPVGRVEEVIRLPQPIATAPVEKGSSILGLCAIPLGVPTWLELSWDDALGSWEMVSGAEFDQPLELKPTIWLPVPDKPIAAEPELSEDETKFLELIRANPGYKFNSGEAYDRNGNPMWGRLESLGLIRAVGSYKWAVTSLTDEEVRAARMGRFPGNSAT